MRGEVAKSRRDAWWRRIGAAPCGPWRDRRRPRGSYRGRREVVDIAHTSERRQQDCGLPSTFSGGTSLGRQRGVESSQQSSSRRDVTIPTGRARQCAVRARHLPVIPARPTSAREFTSKHRCGQRGGLRRSERGPPAPWSRQTLAVRVHPRPRVPRSQRGSSCRVSDLRGSTTCRFFLADAPTSGHSHSTTGAVPRRDGTVGSDLDDPVLRDPDLVQNDAGRCGRQKSCAWAPRVQSFLRGSLALIVFFLTERPLVRSRPRFEGSGARLPGLGARSRPRMRGTGLARRSSAEPSPFRRARSLTAWRSASLAALRSLGSRPLLLVGRFLRRGPVVRVRPCKQRDEPSTLADPTRAVARAERPSRSSRIRK